MAVLVYSEISNVFLDALVANTATDAPFTPAEIARALNEAYADIYELEGGGVTTVASATAWTSAQTATGVVVGILATIKNLLRIWASSTSGSVGVSSGDNKLDEAELDKIQWLRKSSITGTYDRPKLYAVTRMATTAPADVGKLRLDYYPGVTGYYFPIEYTPTLTPIDAATVTTPDVTDLGSRDIGLWAAAKKASGMGRADLVPSIMAELSERNGPLLARKLKAQQSGDPD